MNSYVTLTCCTLPKRNNISTQKHFLRLELNLDINFTLTTSFFEMLSSHFVDPPGETSLIYWPNQVKKKGSVTLMCSVKDEGRPPGPTYQWLRGGHVIHDVKTANWTIDPVTLETESNFTCIAENDGGLSVPATVAFKVLGKEVHSSYCMSC